MVNKYQHRHRCDPHSDVCELGWMLEAHGAVHHSRLESHRLESVVAAPQSAIQLMEDLVTVHQVVCQRVVLIDNGREHQRGEAATWVSVRV